MSNPKVIFHDLFLALPSYDEVVGAVTCILPLEVEAVEEMSSRFIYEDDEVYMDENVFTALYLGLTDYRNEWSPMGLRAVAIAECSSCNKCFAPDCFVSIDNFTIGHRCYTCRKQGKIQDIPALVYMKVCCQGITDANFTYLYKMSFEASRHLSFPIDVLCVGYDQLFDVSIVNRNRAQSPSTGSEEAQKVLKTAQQGFLPMLRTIEKYRYIVHQRATQKRKSESYICSQRKTKPTNPSRPVKRLRESRKQFDCGGTVSFSYGWHNTAMTRVKHELHHEVHLPWQPLAKRAPGMEQNIRDLFETGLTPFQICKHLRKVHCIEFPYNEVYYIWSKEMERRTRRSDDPKTSAIQLITESDNISMIYEQRNPFGVGFIVGTGIEISRRVNIVEILMDSTYKTNKQAMELFAIIGSVNGAGFSLAYFILEAPVAGHNDRGYKTREITKFLTAFKTANLHIKSLFFFSDKDLAQLSAITKVFEIEPSICLWHMKRAIKKKYADLKKSECGIYTKKFEERLLKLVTKHFHMHPFFVDHSIEEIREVCTREMESVCMHHILLKDYLIDNWYGDNWYYKWGRRRADYIPIAKTTMLVESHWRVLKRLYLQNFNRPRIDILIHIIDKSFLSKYKLDYDALLSGKKKPTWWKAFTKEWEQRPRDLITTSTKQTSAVGNAPVLLS